MVTTTFSETTKNVRSPLDSSAELFQKLTVEGTFARVGRIFLQKWGTFLVISTLSVLLNYAVASIFVVLLMTGDEDYENGGAYDGDDYTQSEFL